MTPEAFGRLEKALRATICMPRREDLNAALTEIMRLRQDRSELHSSTRKKYERDYLKLEDQYAELYTKFEQFKAEAATKVARLKLLYPKHAPAWDRVQRAEKALRDLRDYDNKDVQKIINSYFADWQL